jgi:hypothetical protein
LPLRGGGLGTPAVQNQQASSSTRGERRPGAFLWDTRPRYG